MVSPILVSTADRPRLQAARQELPPNPTLQQEVFFRLVTVNKELATKGIRSSDSKLSVYIPIRRKVATHELLMSKHLTAVLSVWHYQLTLSLSSKVQCVHGCRFAYLCAVSSEEEGMHTRKVCACV